MKKENNKQNKNSRLKANREKSKVFPQNSYRSSAVNMNNAIPQAFPDAGSDLAHDNLQNDYDATAADSQDFYYSKKPICSSDI